MKARYHKFTGEIPVVFVEDAGKFIKGLGVELNEEQQSSTPVFMQEINIGPLKMLVFSETLMRTLHGGTKTPVVEAHLALWKGHQKYPNNGIAAYKYALALAERYGRRKAHTILRGKLAEEYKIDVPVAKKKVPTKDQSDKVIEKQVFEEIDDKVHHIDVPELITEAISVNDMKKAIANLIKSADEAVLRKVFSFLNRDSDLYDGAMTKLTSIGIPEKYAKEIIDFSLETGDFDEFAKYLKKRTLTLQKLSKSNDLIAATKGAIKGMSDQFAAWLVNYQWPTTPSMGAGEAALVILLKDGNKPAKGDVGIGNRELEVKGDNGRLKGQHGYGAGVQASKAFEEEFTKLMKKVPAKDRVKVPKAGGTEYNPTKSGRGGWAANDLAKVVVTAGVATRQDIIKIWQKAIGEVFTKMPLGWIAKFVTKSGEIHNTTGFLEKWLEESARYYKRVEKFEAILLMSRKGKFRVLNDSDFSDLGKLVKWSPPNFSSRAGSQGASFGITVK